MTLGLGGNLFQAQGKKDEMIYLAIVIVILVSSVVAAGRFLRWLRKVE